MLEKCTKFTFRMLLFKVAGSLRSQLYLREIPYILNILSHIPRKLCQREVSLLM